MISLIRLAGPLRSHTISNLGPKISPTFFQHSVSPTGINHGASRFPTLQLLRQAHGKAKPKVSKQNSVQAPPPKKLASKKQVGELEAKKKPLKELQAEQQELETRINQKLKTGGSDTKIPLWDPVDDPKSNGTNGAMKAIYGFIAVNIGVFAIFTYTKVEEKRGNNRPFYHFAKNMTANLGEILVAHRYWTLITSNYTHMTFLHLGGNLMAYFFTASLLAQTPGFGPSRMIILTVCSGLAGSVAYLADRYWKFMKTGDDRKYGLGFSGCVTGVSAAAACIYPKTQFQLFMIIPMPLWLLVTGGIVYDGYSMYKGGNTGIGHGGHVGGFAFGILYYLFRLKPLMRMGRM